MPAIRQKKDSGIGELREFFPDPDDDLSKRITQRFSKPNSSNHLGHLGASQFEGWAEDEYLRRARRFRGQSYRRLAEVESVDAADRSVFRPSNH